LINGIEIETHSIKSPTGLMQSSKM